jgi:hypothetical protein
MQKCGIIRASQISLVLQPMRCGERFIGKVPVNAHIRFKKELEVMMADTANIALPVSEVFASGSGRGAGATPSRRGGKKAKGKRKAGRAVPARGRARTAAARGKKKKVVIRKKKRR